MYTAFTSQIDDPQAAVREILEQLRPEENKLKNTIGIIHFYYEFVETEVCKAIADALPFDVVGCVSSYVGAAGRYGDDALIVTMLTGDDVDFIIRTIEGVSAKPADQTADEITRMCAELCAERKPKLLMPFLAMGSHFTGDNLADTINALPEPLPLFGTVAFNMSSPTGAHYTLINSSVSHDTLVFVAVFGDVEPKFHHTNAFIFDSNFISDYAEATEASEAVLKSVNGISALKYLREQGLINDDNESAMMWTIPAILTYPNGTKVVRAFVGIVEGTEHVFATGSIKTGAKIKFAHLDNDSTIASAARMIKDMAEAQNNDAIAYSCLARAWSLGTNIFAEVQKIAECAEEYQNQNEKPFNYSLAYSGGEFCPTWDKDGKMINTLQNYTLTACTFS
jgi:hypothetical protein